MKRFSGMRCLAAPLCASLCCASLFCASVGLAASAVEEGSASWYGERYRGQTTASGEAFDPDQLTAAHLSRPFGSRIKVTRLDTGASVVVRVNDRGPAKRTRRIVDLSRAAAQRLGMIKAGVAPVRIEALGARSPVLGAAVDDTQGALPVEDGDQVVAEHIKRPRSE